MKHKSLIILPFIVFFCLSAEDKSPRVASLIIKTYDGLKVNNTILFAPLNTKPFIIFLHQSNWNLHEYDKISKKFLDLGYNSMSIDLRYGGEMNGFQNLTHLEALKNKKNIDFITSMEDIKASIEALKKRYGQTNVILFGSSISASLALLYASKYKRVATVIAFSPGEYFPENDTLKKSINLKIPVFITGTKEERSSLIPIFMSIQSTFKVLFTPSDKHGQHGSKALWDEYDAHEEYWKSLKNFLNNIESHQDI